MSSLLVASTEVVARSVDAVSLELGLCVMWCPLLQCGIVKKI